MTERFQSILITGASSGLGAALALRYARPGVSLALTGRDPARLAAVSAEAECLGAIVERATIDVTDRSILRSWIEKIDDRIPLDLVIANAGISGGTSGETESEDQARRIVDVNVLGVLNTIYPMIPRMRARRRGSIALMSSLAAFRGLPGAPAYGASKAAVKVLGEALRGALINDGVSVSVICPGFVTTPMTARNRFKMPYLMDAPRAADIIARGLERNSPRIGFPLAMLALVWAVSSLSPRLTDRWLSRLTRQ
jgi:short-subunit dehydrogenase